MQYKCIIVHRLLFHFYLLSQHLLRVDHSEVKGTQHTQCQIWTVEVVSTLRPALALLCTPLSNSVTLTGCDCLHAMAKNPPVYITMSVKSKRRLERPFGAGYQGQACYTHSPYKAKWPAALEVLGNKEELTHTHGLQYRHSVLLNLGLLAVIYFSCNLILND